MVRVLVFNGWAAGPETWELCKFPHDWVFSYIEQLDGVPERVIADMDELLLVGFSMGGASALRLFLDHPEKVKGLVLVSATPCMMEDKARGWKGMSPRRLQAFELGTEFLFGDDPSPLYREDNLRRGIDFLRATDLRAGLEAYARAGHEPIPVALFQSDCDGVVRPSNADYLKSIFPQARVAIVPGTEHVLPVAVPEQIDAAVLAMLAELGVLEDQIL